VQIVADKNEVSLNDVFDLTILVNGSDVKTLLVNIPYPTDSVSVIDTRTYGVFGFIDKVTWSEGYVKYLGVDTKNLDPKNGKVATIKFKVSDDVKPRDFIKFNIVTASINGNKVPTIELTIKVVSQPWQIYDKNKDEKIDDRELLNAIMDWLNGRVSDMRLLNVIMKWLNF